MRVLWAMVGLAAAATANGAQAGWPGWDGHHRRDAAEAVLPVYLVPDRNRIRSRSDAFFMHGGSVRSDGERASFDYDRSYPYDYSFSLPDPNTPGAERPRARSCQTSLIRSSEDERQVRVCRN